ncbi:MAG TPA: hypothetical protein GX719_02840 [Gammaproteobacteria bacterium]|nr:hypothetical protein [Gammaproteobacteria bacterium]
MWDFSLGKSFSLLARTMPFILLRCGVYFGITLAYILMTGVGAGVGYGIGGFGDEGFQTSATIWGGIAGFGVVGGVLFFAREYLLYTVKAGHIAVLVRLIDGEELPQGRSQISYASQIVKQNFAQTNVLFAMDMLIKGVITAITGLVQGIGSLLPIPGLQQLMGVVKAFLRIAVGLIDEVILAYIIRTGSDNPWLASRSALVLYGQNAQVMLKNAAWLTLFTYGLSFVVFLIMLAPAAALVYLIPGAWSAGGMVFALLFAWAVKVAVIEPFAITCLLQAYFKTIQDQTPNPEWEARLDKVSNKFGELKGKAQTWVQPAKTTAVEASE